MKTEHGKINVVLYRYIQQRGCRQSWLGISPSRRFHSHSFLVKAWRTLLVSYPPPVAVVQPRLLRFLASGYSLWAECSLGSFDFQTRRSTHAGLLLPLSHQLPEGNKSFEFPARKPSGNSLKKKKIFEYLFLIRIF